LGGPRGIDITAFNLDDAPQGRSNVHPSITTRKPNDGLAKINLGIRGNNTRRRRCIVDISDNRATQDVRRGVGDMNSSTSDISGIPYTEAVSEVRFATQNSESAAFGSTVFD
jgi:hypothetical protein